MNYLRVLRLMPRQSFKISSMKYATQHPLKFRETQEMWKEKDGITGKWELIYKAPMDKLLNYASTYLTVTSTFVGVAGVYYANFVYDDSLADQPVILGEDIVLADSAAECLTYIGAFVLFHIAVKVLLSKFVIRLYQNGDNYVAIFRGHYFNSIKKHNFHLKDFKKLNPTLVVTWGDARYDIGNKHAIILENYFKTPEYFNQLMYKKKMDVEDEE